MQRRLFVPLLAFGVALSGSALGESSMRSNVTEPQSPAKIESHKQQTHAMTGPRQVVESQPGPVTGPILATPRGPVNMDEGD
jgi:hypothetical protein